MFVTRFAPSPTGYLHRGHAFSALTAFEAARAAGGRFLLRIEDIDATRCRPAFEDAIYEDLAWLGIEWETAVRRQSDHLGHLPNIRAELLHPIIAVCSLRTGLTGDARRISRGVGHMDDRYRHLFNVRGDCRSGVALFLGCLLDFADCRTQILRAGIDRLGIVAGLAQGLT